MKLASLSPRERLQLLRFVCSFVWADLEVGPAERTFVLSLLQRLRLPESEIAHVKEWLETPPPPEEVDPSSVPHEHRRLFLEAVEQAVRVDGTVNPAEGEHLALFRQLTR